MKPRAALVTVLLACLALLVPAAAGAATASWQFEPPTFDFGTRLPAEGPTSAKAFELKNTGEVSLSPTFIAISEEGGAGFKVKHNGCDHTLAPDGGCTIEVTFGPNGGGRKEATLSVETPSPVVPAATAQLIGSGGEPIVVIDPATVTFDTVMIPTNSLLQKGSERSIKITNAGVAELSFRELAFSEDGLPSDRRPDFVGRGEVADPGLCNPREVVPPGGSCSINLEFRPQSPGTFRASVGLVDNAPGSPQTITLEGTAVAQTVIPPPLPPPPPLASTPKFGRKPAAHTKSRTATFVFSAESSPAGFKCRWTKRGEFHSCASPFHLHELKPGPHVFSVYAVSANGALGPVRTYHWQVLR